MPRKPKSSTQATGPRRRAGARPQKQPGHQGPGTGGRKPATDARRSLHKLQLHKLQLHQEELKTQNAELKEARDRAEALLEKYTDLYDLAPVAYLTLDRAGSICEANLACANLLGIERSRLLKRRLGPFVSAADRPAFNAFLKKVFGSKASESCELSLRIERRPLLDVRMEASAAASARECRVTITDITDRKRTEEALRQSEARLRLALDASNAGTWSWDVATNRSAWDERHHALYGFEPQDAVSFEHWIGRVHPEDRERLLARIRTVCEPEGGDSWNEEFRTLHPVLGERWMAGVGRLERGADGRAIRLTGINLDITERRRAEEAQREQLAQIDVIYQDAPLGLCLLDTQFRYVRVNEALAGLNGVPVEKHLGRTVREVVPDLAEATEAICRQVAATGQPVLNIEMTGQTAAQPGVIRIWAAHWSPVKLPDGRWIGVNVIVQEITERKRAEEALREARDTLERRVQERTAELEAANAALRESQATLQAFYDSSPFIMAVGELAGSETVAVSANAALARLLGRTPEQIVNRTATELGRTPELGSFWVEAYQRCLREGAPVRFEVASPTPAGNSWFSATVAFLGEGPQGRPRFSVVAEDITERKAAALRLQEALELNRTIVAASAVGISAYKASGQCIFANESLARITGLSVHQLLQQDFRRIRSFLDSPLLQMAESALADGRALSGEIHVVTSAGKEVWVHCHQIPFALGGEPHLLHMAHDISEQKQAEHFLMAQRDLAGLLSQTWDLSVALDRLLEAALQIPGVDCGGVYLRDPETGGFALEVHRGLSPKFVEATAFYPADSAGVRVLQEAQPLYTLPPSLAQPLDALLKAEAIAGLAVVPLVHDGRLIGSFNLGSRTCPALPSSSRVAVEAVGALAVGAIARIQAGQALQDSEARLRAFLRNSAVVGWMKDDRGRYEFLSENLQKRFQVRLDEWRGKTDFELWPREIAEILHGHDLAVANGGRAMEVLEPILNPDGSRSWWLSSKFPFQDASGRRHIGGLSVDVTAHRKAEEELRQLNEVLEQRVQERTAELQAVNTELRLRENELQNLSRRLIEVQEIERRALALELHDEIGQSLTSLRLAMDRGAIEQARAAAHELVARVRDLSLDLRPSMLDDLGLLPALLWQFERYTVRCGIQVRFTHQGLEGRRLGPSVETAAYRIVQEALTNVARHAAVPEVSVRALVAEGGLRLQVQDAGRGFEVVTALASGRSSGLRGMMERASLLGGRLVINSDPGAGTFLLIELPPGDDAPAAT